MRAWMLMIVVSGALLSACETGKSGGSGKSKKSDTVGAESDGQTTTPPPEDDATVAPPSDVLEPPPPDEDTWTPPLEDTWTPPPDDTWEPPPEDSWTPPPPKDTVTPPKDTNPPKDTSPPPKDTAGTGTTPVGEPCSADGECAGGADAFCIPDTYSDGSPGFPGGYCSIQGCTEGSCPGANTTCIGVQTTAGDQFDICVSTCTDKSDCYAGYACDQGVCWPGCTPGSCDAGLECNEDLVCAEPPPAPCTANSCGAGYICQGGTCVPDVDGGPGPGPGPTCNNLPTKDCVGTKAYCGELIPFEPLQGDGWDNYPINGECDPCGTKKCDGYGQCLTNGQFEPQWRSWARRDLVMLMQWATAFVKCKTAGWAGGNGLPLGMGDMSEKNGTIPGTSLGDPGHPAGTHEDGYDMDIAYYQIKGPDNHLRPICEHTINGQEQYHCTKAPDNLDLWRHTLFLGALMTSDRTRVIGVDGKVGALIEEAMPTLCANGWLAQKACNNVGQELAFEVTDQGLGWYLFHLHHSHISLWGVNKPGPAGPQTLRHDGGPAHGDGLKLRKLKLGK